LFVVISYNYHMKIIGVSLHERATPIADFAYVQHPQTRFHLCPISHYYHIPKLTCIHSHHYFKTANIQSPHQTTIHSQVDFCNSLYHNLTKSHISTFNTFTRAVVKALNPVKSYCVFHWFKRNLMHHNALVLQCFDTVGWATGRASSL